MKIFAAILLIVSIHGFIMAVYRPGIVRKLAKEKAKWSARKIMMVESTITTIETLVLGRVLGWW